MENPTTAFEVENKQAGQNDSQDGLLSVLDHAYNPSIQEAEAGGWKKDQDQSVLRTEV